MHELHIHDAENEDELVEDEVPKFVFQVVIFGNSQLAEDQSLDHLAEQHQATEGHVDKDLGEEVIRLVISCCFITNNEYSSILASIN